MFICTICQKNFNTHFALNGHKRMHGKSLGKIKLIKKRTIKKQSDYSVSPNCCKECNIILTYKKRLNLFCSRSCAATHNNRKRIKKDWKLSEKSKNQISLSFKKHIDKQPKQPKCQQKQQKIFLCQICNKEHNNKKRMTCSQQCANHLISIKRQQKIKNSNWNQKRKTFVYKDITIECDSKLEEAGIIYLKDVLKATKIERYKNLINYYENNSHRTFNPDFWAIIDNKPSIIEIKMIWTSKNQTHHYVRTIPFKKAALKDFCQNKNYQFFWLDTNNEILKRIYTEHCSVPR